MSDNRSFIKTAFEESAKNISALSQSQVAIDALELATANIVQAYENGGCLYVAGNGGSAADAQHIVAEFVSKLHKDRDPIRSFAMTVNTSILTAIGNDYGYEKCFERQVYGLMGSKDVFLGISTSGNSKNILLALKACRDVGAKSIVLTGESGGEAVALADTVIKVPATRVDKIQESHVIVYHTLCELVEKELVEKGLVSYK